MKQNYHINANTNSHSRAIIHRAKDSNVTLAQRFQVIPFIKSNDTKTS